MQAFKCEGCIIIIRCPQHIHPYPWGCRCICDSPRCHPGKTDTRLMNFSLHGQPLWRARLGEGYPMGEMEWRGELEMLQKRESWDLVTDGFGGQRIHSLSLTLSIAHRVSLGLTFSYCTSEGPYLTFTGWFTTLLVSKSHDPSLSHMTCSLISHQKGQIPGSVGAFRTRSRAWLPSLWTDGSVPMPYIC